MGDAALKAAEDSVVGMIASSFTGEDVAAPEPEPTPAAETEIEKFEFDADFQSKVAGFAVRDDEFMRRVAHVLKPEYFEHAGEAALVNIALRHFKKYRCVPDNASLTTAIKDDITAKIIRTDIFSLVAEARKSILTADLRNRGFVEDKVIEFARHQAVSQAIYQSVGLIEKRQFDKIEEAIRKAVEVGINEDGDEYDYFDRVEERNEERIDAMVGKRKPLGITTGNLKLDEQLYHKGWGRRELTSIMGGPKSGKTTALINFAKAASIAGMNVLYVSLEVSAKIISDRLDACVAEVHMKELSTKTTEIKDKVDAARKRAGRLLIREFPSGTMTPNMLRNLIERYKGTGVNADGSIRPPTKFDMIVVDYADIMAPNYRTQDAIENSKSVYVDLRAIAQEENVAMLTATQTNREGYKAAVAKAEHVAEDFNKVRTVDLMISINKTEEEAKRGEARLYFAASRNQESGFTVVIQQNIGMMKFIDHVIKVE